VKCCLLHITKVDKTYCNKIRIVMNQQRRRITFRGNATREFMIACLAYSNIIIIKLNQKTAI